MNETWAKWVCGRNGSQLFSYEEGKAAFIALPSGDQVVISIGEDTAVLLTPSFLRGWNSPEVQAAYPLEAWVPGWSSMVTSDRQLPASLILDGLLELFSGCQTLVEAKMAMGPWLKNPQDIAQSLNEEIARKGQGRKS